jgi:F0F1-type ATP synthase assembly protein I
MTKELRVGRELMDTTWRIATPVLVFAGLGLIIDRQTTSAPWATIGGMIIGLAIAAILVKQQINRWQTPLPKPGSYERNRKPGDKEDDKDYYND